MLTLKPAYLGGPDDYLVLEEERHEIGRIMRTHAAPREARWLWTITGLAAVRDDSGARISTLNGRPTILDKTGNSNPLFPHAGAHVKLSFVILREKSFRPAGQEFRHAVTCGIFMEGMLDEARLIRQALAETRAKDYLQRSTTNEPIGDRELVEITLESALVAVASSRGRDRDYSYNQGSSGRSWVDYDRNERPDDSDLEIRPWLSAEDLRRAEAVIAGFNICNAAGVEERKAARDWEIIERRLNRQSWRGIHKDHGHRLAFRGQSSVRHCFRAALDRIVAELHDRGLLTNREGCAVKNPKNRGQKLLRANDLTRSNLHSA